MIGSVCARIVYQASKTELWGDECGKTISGRCKGNGRVVSLLREDCIDTEGMRRRRRRRIKRRISRARVASRCKYLDSQTLIQCRAAAEANGSRNASFDLHRFRYHGR